MGREIKRVPLGFDWPIDEVWSGYLMSDSLSGEKCASCDGDGGSPLGRHLHARWYGDVPFDPTETGSTPLTADTPAVRAFAERNVARSPQYYGPGPFAVGMEAQRLADLFNSQWSHHLTQEDVDALVEGNRLYDFTHTWVKGDGWQPKDPAPVVTAAEVNEWSLQGMAHDSINCWVVVAAACERAGDPGKCLVCDGHGSTERYPGQRADADAWTKTEPPVGDGWQLWSTTTEGHPMSPVFETGEALAWWMSQNDCLFARSRPTYEAALKFVGDGWAPSMMGSAETGVADGITFAARGLGPDDALVLAAAIEGGES